MRPLGPTLTLAMLLLAPMESAHAAVDALCTVVDPASPAVANATDTLLIDVRDRVDPIERTYPGTLRIAPEFLPGKAFLRDKALVLITRDAASTRVTTLCERLAKAGFRKVSLAVPGHGVGAGLIPLSAGDYLAARDAAHWHVVLLTADPLPPPIAFDSWIHVDPARLDQDAALAAHLIQKLRNEPPTRPILLVSALGQHVTALAQGIAGHGLPRMHHLTGGWDALLTARQAVESPARGPRIKTAGVDICPYLRPTP